MANNPSGPLPSRLHEYPADAMPYTAAYVNIEHLLENMKKENMEKGAWINVIGYVVPQSIEEMRPKIMISDHCSAFVQAIAMWSAGTIEQKSYERSLAQRMMTGK
ncbi:MAG: hypothetical protein M1820_008876 [Bogoriella megaspora]|nr:MAG: hypothetical protein M1820_008876 [Bogoriella megaspora]